MHRPTAAATLAFVLSSAYSVQAFAGTSPIVAWSDSKLDSLSLLSSTPPSSTGSSPQQTFSEDSDLCSLSSLLVVSIPGLHFSDLARLPLSTSSPAGISAALAQAESSITQPYVREHTLSKPLKMVRRFEKECGAVFESQQEKNVWNGGQDAKSIRIVQIDGLDEFELNGEGAGEGRKQVLENADNAVAYHLSNLRPPHAVIVTALPASYSSPRRLNVKQPHLHLNENQKRQLLEPSITDLPEEEEEFISEVLEEIEEEQAFDNMMDRVTTHETTSSSTSTSDIGVSDIVTPEALIEEEEQAEESEEWDGEMMRVSPYASEVDYEAFKKDGDKKKKNGTSIFEPEENSGLLHRYVFFTPALVFSLLVTLMVLIPTILIAVTALTSIETSHGLETKMTGSVGIDPAKA